MSVSIRFDENTASSHCFSLSHDAPHGYHLSYAVSSTANIVGFTTKVFSMKKEVATALVKNTQVYLKEKLFAPFTAQLLEVPGRMRIKYELSPIKHNQ